MQTIDRDSVPQPEREDVARPPAPASPPPRDGSEPRRASARDVFITILVCLSLWALLVAPDLERSAEAGPVGARRTAALAVLRPLVALSNGLFLSRATGAIERALGREPGEAPGGELVLPAFVLPADEFEPAPKHPAPETDDDEDGSKPKGAGQPSPGKEEKEGEPEPAMEGIRTPTRSNPLRVAVIGDSLSQGLGPAIARWFDPNLVRVLSLGRQSTGLSRADYFNWQAGMRQIEEKFRPDLVFVLLGSNDGQAQISRSGDAIPVGSVEWVQGYRDRAAQLLRAATRDGTRVVWVGIPIVRDRDQWEFFRRVNGIYRDTAKADPFGTFLDTWSLFDAKDGGYTAFVRNERGELIEVRASDGVHFTPTGYSFLGRLAIRAAEQAFDVPDKAATFRF